MKGSPPNQIDNLLRWSAEDREKEARRRAVTNSETPSHGPPYGPLQIPKVLAAVQAQILPGAKRCFDDGLECDPRQAGDVVIFIEIAPAGEVSSATVQTNRGLSENVANCIAAVAGRAKFERPGQYGAKVRLPFRFVARGRD
ncbi:MAG TPA: AgmX/PglI C-terminal domain-containing protein [Polyangiaceae bacterium]|jgi:hypothetical protein